MNREDVATNDWELFESRYGDIIPDFCNFIKALERPFPIGLRENSLHCLPYSLSDKLKEESFVKPCAELSFYEVQGDRKRWGGDLDHHLGLYFMQALSSLFSSLNLGPTAEDLVLDMCAAPGGKTTHLAQLMDNRGTLVACEPDLNRMRVLKANLNRLGVYNTTVMLGKAQDIDFPKESFDKILLDGPCSSEGTFRSDVISGKNRRKTNYLSYNDKFRKNLQQEQRRLMDKAYELLAPQGILVYSTCTYDPDENERQVDYFLNKYQDMTLQEMKVPDSLDIVPGLTQYRSESFHPDCHKCWRIYPHKVNSIGFFIGKFIKR